MTNNILLISNGHGEDVIGAKLLQNLIKRNQNINIKVLPIVGLGSVYNSLDVQLIGPRKKMPSGGLLRFNFENMKNDFKAGLLGLTLSQIKTLKKAKANTGLVIVVGDIYILLLAGLFVNKDIIFLPTAKSEYINGHYWIENLIMKKYANIVLPRDKKTEKAMRKAGINATYVGNAMMDCFDIKQAEFGLDKEKITVGILPGSREEAYVNMKQVFKVIEELEDKAETGFNYITAMASNLSVLKLIDMVQTTDWTYQASPAESRENGVELIVNSPSNKSKVEIIYHHFGDVLDKSDIFIGLAGTANEQAAGMGKPVVAFPVNDTQFTEKFAKAQKSLLRGSVSLVENNPEIIAETIINIINNKEMYRRMSTAGKKRMGEPGAIKNMNDIIIEFLRKKVGKYE
ncbi:MAG: lipid-A-disaccharide synthase-related protein [Halanaerobiales bacterium]